MVFVFETLLVYQKSVDFTDQPCEDSCCRPTLLRIPFDLVEHRRRRRSFHQAGSRAFLGVAL